MSRSTASTQDLHSTVWAPRRVRSTVVGRVTAYARAHAAHLIRFVLIGSGLAALNLALLYCFRTRLHLTDPVAVAAMYLLGTGLHFAAHRWITYAAQDRPALPQGMRYALMLVWNFLVMQALVWVAARLSIPAYLAVMTSIGCTMILNFLFMTHIVFTKDRPR
jgi:putative flippase GtrA